MAMATSTNLVVNVANDLNQRMIWMTMMMSYQITRIKMGLIMIRMMKRPKMKHLKMIHPKNHHHHQQHHNLFVKSTNNVENVFASTTQPGPILVLPPLG
eukprot:13635476-Ditylum_brightwellii.AAC.1